MSRWKLLIVVSVCLLFAKHVRVEASAAHGAKTGDGSTPFTGLAKAPEANMFIGAAMTEIPIAVPPGRGGIEPKLRLMYSSQGGPSPYGYGWDLPLGHVQRSTRNGAVLCGYETDEFLVVLPEAQVECRLSGERCLPVVEESFLRIEHRPSSDSWVIWDRSGRRYEFGTTPEGREPKRPLPNCKTFRWYLTRVEDLNGNFLTIDYETNLRQDTAYPSLIRYTGNTRTQWPPAFAVHFWWRTTGFRCPGGEESGRPCADRVIDAIGGYPRELDRLLDRVEVKFNGRTVRSYALEYEFDLGGSWSNRYGRVSFLSAVTLFDGRGLALARRDGRPASTTFLYRNLHTGQAGFWAAAQVIARPQFGTPIAPLQGNGSPYPADLEADRKALRRVVTWGRERTTYRDLLDLNGDGFTDLVNVNTDCMTWGQDLTLRRADWDVYFGSPAGFAATPTEWSIRGIVEDEFGPPVGSECPGIRFTRLGESDARAMADVFDIDGDGFPDYVTSYGWSPSQPYWDVHRGRPPDATHQQWRFDPPVPFPAPAGYLRRTESGRSFLGFEDGSADLADLIDMNGDGRPDYVSIENGEVLIWHNNGTQFSPTPMRLDTPWRVLRFTTRNGLQIAALADMNGDGLADQVLARDPRVGSSYTGKWFVMINTGNDVVGPLEWSLPTSPCGWNGIQMTLNDGRGDVVRDLLDVNGDGLPDAVETCSSVAPGRWQVWFNRGAGFADEPFPWRSAPAQLRNLGEQRFGGTTVSYTYADTFDVDGDHMVDFANAAAEFSFPGKIALYHNGNGAWCPSENGRNCANQPAALVARNPFGLRPDLMIQSENGLGSVTLLEYEPSTVWDNTDNYGVSRLPWVQWTVAEITRTDGLCGRGSGTDCVIEGSHQITTELHYAYGRYEPRAREFRGFRTVMEVQPNGYRKVRFFHQDAVRKGKVEASMVLTPDDELLVHETSTWGCLRLDPSCHANPATCQPTPCPHIRQSSDRYWVRFEQSLRYDTTNFVIRAVSGTTNLEWDAYGNVVRTRRFGSQTKPVDTITLYHLWDEPSRYLVDRARESWTVDDPQGTQATLQREWYSYDDAGNLTEKYAWVNPVPPGLEWMYRWCPGGGLCTRSRLTYTAEGNVQRVEDTWGRRTITLYEDVTRTYPRLVEDPAGHQVDFEYDPACGVKTGETTPHTPTAPNPPAARWEYDTFCRLRAEFRPGDRLPTEGDPRGQPYRQFAHVLGAPGYPTAIEARTLIDNRRYLSRFELYDALGRSVQSQREGYVDGRRVLVVETTRVYNELGLLTRKAAPFTTRGRGGELVPLSPDTGWTSYQYDGLGRVIVTRLPDGAVTRRDHSVAWTTTSWDACAVARNCAGSITTERRDAYGRVVESRTVASSDGRFLQGTLRTYDGLGRLLTLTQAGDSGQWNYATMVIHEYDTRGLLVRREDPNSGTWSYGYDPNGKRVYEDDPTPGRHISLCYDDKDRLVAKHYYTGDSFVWRCGEEPAISFGYDTYPDVIDAAAVGADPEGAFGRITRVEERSDDGGTVISSLYYDRAGRVVAARTTMSLPGESATSALLQRTYDAAGNITSLTYPDGEVVRHRYDRAGQLYAVLGNRVYARKITYDLFGRPREIRFGNGTRDVRTYATATGAFRLLASETTRGAARYQSLAYRSYTANGLVGEILDQGSTAGIPELDRSESFNYDGLGRLTSCTLPQSNATITYQYNALGNITRKEGSTFAYDPYRPHRATAIDTTDNRISYDANGNRIRKPGYDFTYDADNRLVRINGGAVEFHYDHTGMRIGERRSGGSWKRYYFGLIEAEPGYATKFYFAGNILLASQRSPNQQLAQADREVPPWTLLARTAATGQPGLQLSIRTDVAQVGATVLFVTLALLCLAPGRGARCFGQRIRPAFVIGLLVVWSSGTLPWPLFVSRAEGQSLPSEFRYFHLNHLGSTQLVTDSSGRVVVHVRYLPYGGVLGYFDSAGRRLPTTRCAASSHGCREFTGYEREPASGLQYAGFRFYDPDLGQFSSLDPAMPQGSPYAYAAWSPTNATDAQGAFLETILVILVGIFLSAAINAMSAAAQGLPLSKIGQAALAGAITGAVAIGLGIVAGGVALATSALAGNIKLTSVAQAVDGLAKVGARAAFSTVISKATEKVAEGAGLSDEWVYGLSTLAGYGATYMFDQMIGAGLPSDSSAPAKPGFQLASNTSTHNGITYDAALEAGYPAHLAERITAANQEQDAVGQGFFKQLGRMLNNEDHFDLAAKRAEAFHLDKLARGGNKVYHLGAASHYLQDRYAFGHMLVGTHLFSGPLGSPVRVLIHQTVGGEVTLHNASSARTLELFQKYCPTCNAT
ncbi:MAG: FG-GAP-like repeat-containing protein [Candidatus Binatia bacterium]|nr:FG-GAP-like repeat-containing protein [Candidatus Binatia bacterium]